MLTLILTTMLSAAPQAPVTAQFQPCVWPNRCAAPAVTTAATQFQPCVWPNRCS